MQCIVAAELVALAGPSGIKCGGAMLRDVGVYCLAIFSVLLAFALGQVGVRGLSGLLHCLPECLSCPEHHHCPFATPSLMLLCTTSC